MGPPEGVRCGTPVARARLSAHLGRRGAVRKGTAQRTAQPVAANPVAPEPTACHMNGTVIIPDAGPYAYTFPMMETPITATLIGYAR